jgi:hypothetical protein
MTDKLFLLLALLVLLALPKTSRAEPYLAMEMGLKCVACHVNPTGGALRNATGLAFAKGVIPANQLPEMMSNWNGGIGDYLRIGGDLRTSVQHSVVPDEPTQTSAGLDQFRVYGDVQLIPDRLGIYVDDTLAPGNAQVQEAYVRTSLPGMAWYAKAGQFYLPFGWRLQDSTAFVRSVSGISMTTPDKGVELGMEQGDWSAQFDVTDGVGNAGTGHGYQVTSQLIWVQSWGRMGAAATTTSSPGGDRQVAGVFGGLRTGPLVWLAEADLVSDASFPQRRKMLATLLEMDWIVRQGHNLKLTGETYDPDRKVANDNQARYSLVYEYTPIPFLQIRAGYRKYLGIPQNNLENRQLEFLELHGYF